ncbi:MAG: AMP-binding protein [Candidatus Thiodiazotropha sp. 6PLUC9]
MKLFDRISQYALEQPDAPAIVAGEDQITYAELQQSLSRLKAELRALQVSTLALALDNGPAWALLDLAAISCGITLVPLPPFFSHTQLEHALKAAGVEMVITDNGQGLQQGLPQLSLSEVQNLQLCGHTLTCLATALPPQNLPSTISKITFTSGTTAEPKGVMLEWMHMEQVVESLAEAVDVSTSDRHVALTPMAVLLENIAGLYIPLWSGASVALPSLRDTGLLGAAGLDAQKMLNTMTRYDATTAIFSPQMLQGMVTALNAGAPYPEQLRFVALGGAAVSKRLLQQALELQLPVYEGYGLSEFSSVVCLNRLGDQRLGSVGKPLKHVALKIADDGEVLISGNCFTGYLGDSKQESSKRWWHSGDIGFLDDDGFLHLQGRRRHVFITAYGRNVSPEWVERELVMEPAIAQAAIFGEARPWNCAVILPSASAGDIDVEAAIEQVNALLPDYARITQWLIADSPFGIENGQLSGTGRLRRESIYQYYQERIDALYLEELVS